MIIDLNTKMKFTSEEWSAYLKKLTSTYVIIKSENIKEIDKNGFTNN